MAQQRSTPPRLRGRCRAFTLLGAGLVFIGILPLLLSAPPAWWSQRGATNSNSADDYAAANIGQLKHFASKAQDELHERLPGTVLSGVDNLVTIWRLPPTAGISRDDYAVVTIGQLKAVAQPFYDSLITVTYTNSYPWTLDSADDDNLAAANLGQLKKVFAFDLTAPSGQIPSWWQRYYFNGQTGIDPQADADEDGITNLLEYQQQKDPKDYYNGQIPSESAPPSAPANFRATKLSNGSIKYEWDDTSNNERGFVIERQDANGNWYDAATVGANKTSIILPP